jgi:hypothetical protein
MNKAQRRAHAATLVAELKALREEWKTSEKEEVHETPKMAEASRRERLKTIEAEAAMLRLMQSEDRLLVQLAVGVLGFVGGSAITLLVKTLLD